MDGVLTGPEIKRCVEAGSIEVTPYDEQLVNPGSLDLRLGNKVVVYSRFAGIDQDGNSYATYSDAGAPFWVPPQPDPIDVKEPEPTCFPYEFDDKSGFVLKPGILYLMHTLEVVKARDHRPEVHGKSSVGRLGVFVHVTAGLGEPGFNGQYTLEVLSTYPTRVYAGMRFCQISFETLRGEVTDYQKTGTYTEGALSLGPVGSRIWKQFK
jgi:dCTP deaminase